MCCTGTDHKWRTRSSEHKPTKVVTNERSAQVVVLTNLTHDE